MATKKSADLTERAVEGFVGADVSYLWSSPSYYAQALGRYFRESGRPKPHDVRMGRGSRIHASGMLFRMKDCVNRVVLFEREK